ncbi:MAG: hypothetical protein RQ751_07410 [Longimicrobiales bacterium]|nr:hypothetical protein [Longimicrobiales bacterium]
MQAQRRELYREHTGWPLGIQVLVWGALVGAALGIFREGGGARVPPEPGALLAALGAMALAFALHAFLGGLTVVVESDTVRVGLGNGRLVRTRIPLEEIRSMEPVTYRPLRDFGGWGLRGGRQKRAWTARGNRALALTLRDGRQVYLGSDDPERLAARIRMAMGAGRAG